MTSGIAKRLKDFRIYLNFTQVDMANLLNMTQSNYSRLEKGTQDLTTKVLTILLSKGINLNWLYTGQGNMLLDDKNELFGLSPEEYSYANDDLRDEAFMFDGEEKAQVNENQTLKREFNELSKKFKELSDNLAAVKNKMDEMDKDTRDLKSQNAEMANELTNRVLGAAIGIKGNKSKT
jgi:transcriptional regulator with XRE-family HTH domain